MIPEFKNNNLFLMFKHRNYRLLWGGNTFSQFGDHMQQVAQNWLVWQITGSPSALGLAVFSGVVPRLILGITAGPLVDSLNRRRLLGYSQMLALVSSLLFTFLISIKQTNLLLVVTFIFILGATKTLEQMARQALLPEVVPREQIAQAVSLNQTGNNLAKVVGPALGGILIPLTGVAGLMLINSLSYGAILIALWLMKLPESQPEKTIKGFTTGLKEGYQFIWHTKELRFILYLALIPALLIQSFTGMLPAYVDTVLRRGPEFFGLLTAVYGVGAILGAVSSTAVGNSLVGNRVTLLMSFIQGTALLFFAWSTNIWVALIMLMLLGFSSIVYTNHILTKIQLTTPQVFLGRVMGVFILNKAFMALGVLLQGLACKIAGIGTVFAVSSLIYLAAGTGFQFYVLFGQKGVPKSAK